MATMNPAMAQPTDPTAAAPDASQPQGTSGYLICLHVDGDSGQISVGVESDQEEASEGAQADEQQEQADYTPVGSIGEALQLAKTIYQNNGQMPDQGGADLAAAKSGYAKYSKGRPQMTAPGGMFGEE